MAVVRPLFQILRSKQVLQDVGDAYALTNASKYFVLGVVIWNRVLRDDVV